MYTKITMYWLPSFLYYVLCAPILLIKALWWHYRLGYDRKRILSCIWTINILRTEAYNYSEKNLDKRQIFFIKYQLRKNYIGVKCLLKKKCKTEEYENFANMIGKRTSCVVSKIAFEKGWCTFKIYYPFEAEKRYEVDVNGVTIGMSADGLKKWNWTRYCHALISGIIGQGKTEFVKTLLIPLLNQGYKVYCIDGKDVDYGYLSKYFEGYTPYDRGNPETMLKLVRKFEFFMRQRFEEMQKMGVNSFVKGGYEPQFLIIDEQLMILKDLKKESKDEFERLISSIILLGRAAGFVLISTMQRPDAKYISGDLRDNYGLRIVLGGAKPETYRMMFDGGDYEPQGLGKGWYSMGIETDVFAWAYREDVQSELKIKPKSEAG